MFGYTASQTALALYLFLDKLQYCKLNFKEILIFAVTVHTSACNRVNSYHYKTKGYTALFLSMVSP